MLNVLFLGWEAITTWQVALLTFVCVHLSYEEKKKSQGQVNVPECFKNPTKSVYICYIDLFYRQNIQIYGEKYIYLHRVTSESAALFCHSGGGETRDEYIIANKLATKSHAELSLCV